MPAANTSCDPVTREIDCPDCGLPYDENCADCDVPAGWISLAARLAEVEAANAKFIEKLNTHLTAEDRRSLAALLGYELGVEEGRAEGQSERDRLAQELEDALGHLRAVLDAWDPMAENYEMGPFFEAREFLARFPVRGEDDGS